MADKYKYESWADRQTERLTKPTKGSPVVSPFFPDTKAGVDHFTKTLKEDQNTTPAKAKEIDKLGLDMKKSLVDYHGKQIKPFDQFNKESYPSTPKQRGHLLELDKLEKDVEAIEGKPVKRDHFKHFTKTGELLKPTKQEIQRAKLPSAWDAIYQSMTPIEKGQWNAEQRRKGMNGKTGDPIAKTIPNEVNQVMNNELESIRKMRMDAERIREIPERRLEIKKTIPAGLHETFTQDKLLEGDILRQIEEDNEKI